MKEASRFNMEYVPELSGVLENCSGLQHLQAADATVPGTCFSEAAQLPLPSFLLLNVRRELASAQRLPVKQSRNCRPKVWPSLWLGGRDCWPHLILEAQIGGQQSSGIKRAWQAARQDRLSSFARQPGGEAAP